MAAAVLPDGGPRAPAQPEIFYCTDVEGDLDYFLRLVDASQELVRLVRYPALGGQGSLPAPPPSKRPGCHGMRLEFASPHAHFVYGGDACDKQPGDIRFVSLLLDLWDRHPDRVHFILGNRDTNKLRFFAELHPDPEDRANLPDPAAVSRRCYWDPRCWQPDADPASDREAPLSYPVFLASHSQANNLEHSWIAILKWMLVCTMGSPDLFEFRRREIAILRNSRPQDVTDAEVYRSFRASVDPQNQGGCAEGPPDARLGAWMLEFNRIGRPALILGPYMFIHGAVSPSGAGWVPGRAERVPLLEDWVEALGAWHRAGIASYERTPENPEAYLGLLDYNLPSLTGAARHSGVPALHHGGASIVNADWFENGDSAPIAAAVLDYFRAGDPTGRVRWVITGHKPHGDCPAVIRNYRKGDRWLGVVDCDTSYSDPGLSARRAYSRVQLYSDRILVTGELGTLGGGRRHGYLLQFSESDGPPPEDEAKDADDAAVAEAQQLVGRQLRSDDSVPEAWRGAWVKTVIRNWQGGVELAVVKAVGFSLRQIHWSVPEVRGYLAEPRP